MPLSNTSDPKAAREAECPTCHSTSPDVTFTEWGIKGGAASDCPDSWHRKEPHEQG